MAKAVLKLKSELVEVMPLPVRSPSNIHVLPSKTAKTRLQFIPDFRKMGAAFIPPLFVMLFALLMWQIFASSPTSGLPPPTTVLAESSDFIFHPFFDNGGTDKGLGLHVFASLKRVALGYSFAAIVGIALGTLVGASQLFMRGLDPLFQILRTVPPLAWLPISLAAFKDGQPSAIFVIFITAIWPIIINTATGIRNIPDDYRNVARVIQLNPWQYFTKIMVPASAPYIFTGLRIGIGLSWLAIVAAEMLIGGTGIGFFIWDAWNSSHISDIIVALFYVGIVGFLLDKLVSYVGSIVTHGMTVN